MTSVQEEWRPVVGFEGDFSVSNLGRVRRDKGGYGRARAGLIYKPQWHSTGYHRYVLIKDGQKYLLSAHHIVLEAFVGPRPEGAQANHIDGDKTNNAADNLEWATAGENTRHAYAHGLANGPKGTMNGNAKLNEDKVRLIRSLAQVGVTQKEIATRFGVSPTAIQEVINGRRWGHVKEATG